MLVSFVYTNHRGETAQRYVQPVLLYFGTAPFHETPTWLLDAWDVEKKAHRSFAMDRVREWATCAQMPQTALQEG